MFFNYPQWLGQASDPSMTVPPQPTFRPAKNRKHHKQQAEEHAPAAAQIPSSFSNHVHPDSTRVSFEDILEDSQSSWEPADFDSVPNMNPSPFYPSYGDIYTSDGYSYSPETFAADMSNPWNHTAGNDDAYTTSTPLEHEADKNAGQPPAYQESETYYYRLSDFYPFVHISPLDYVHVEHHPPPMFFQSWCDNVVDDMYQRDFAGSRTHERRNKHDYSRDNRSKRATWSSPPFTSAPLKPKETPHLASEGIPSAPEKKTPKLGTYSFSFLSQREIFSTSSLDSLRSHAKRASAADISQKTMNSRSRPTTPLSKPFVYVKALTLKDALSQYDEHWSILLNVDSDSSVRWTFRTLPWPQFPSPTSIEDINARKIQRFLQASDVNLKIPLRKALLRFHPDKIPKLLANVETKDRELVSQGCSTVARCLNEIKGSLRV